MKLLRYGNAGSERPGLLDSNGKLRDLSACVGDIISTGTPPGVGLGQKQPVYLKAGQVMRLEIEGLGEQRQKTVQA